MTTNSSGSPRAADAAQRLKDKAAAVRDSAEGTVEEARHKVSAAYSAGRAKASRVGERASGGIEKNPLSMLIGGLAIGAAIGALLPRTRKEADALGGVGRSIRDAAGEAARAAKRAGSETLDSLGVNTDAAREQARKLLDNAVSAATNAGEAAVKTVRRKQD
ncbi:hypothetical protein ACMT1E_06870 [Sphingomonas flavalba]|uniref:hypothetical protein n=1 Tax=Sphingomonas flavalba TaxID=2559804 RepID=UPI0039E00AC1